MPEKFATAAATQSYFSKQTVHEGKTRRFGALTVSALAMGSYLGDSDAATDAVYERTFVDAGLSGVNFFDTAVNYRCQRSERNLAFAIRKLAAHGVFRDQLVVSTKGGFLPADGDPRLFQDYVLKCFLNTGLLAVEDIVQNCHAMTPKFLDAMIDLSLKNLKLDAIDLYYLHNPEIQLTVLSSDEFYRKLTDAFALFEQKVADGKIKNYGLATWNGFRESPGARGLLDLEKIVACARSVAGDKHHLAAIQLPYNLAMLEAVAIQNQNARGELLPAIPAAVHHGLSVFVSAPLMQSHTLKIPPRIFDAMPGDLTPAQKSLQFVTSSPGVVAAMVGMKRAEHLAENGQVLREADWSVTELQSVAPLLVR